MDDTFVKLKPLVAAAGLDASFDGLVSGLRGARFSATIRVTLVTDQAVQGVTVFC